MNLAIKFGYPGILQFKIAPMGPFVAFFLMFVLFIPVLWRFQEKAELRKMQVVVSAAATAFSKDIKEVRKHLREAGSSAEDSRNAGLVGWWSC